MSKEDEKVLLESETVTLPKNEFAAILSRLERLENPGVPARRKKVDVHVGHLRVWDGNLVVRIGNAEEHFELPSSHKERLTIDVGLLNKDGKQVKKTLNYLDFITNATKNKVKFLKFTKNERVEVDMEKGGGGYANREAVDKEGRATPYKTSEEIAMEVGFTDVSVEVEVLEGDFVGQVISFGPGEINAINA